MSRYSQAIAFFPPRRVLSGDNMSKTLLAALLSVCAVAANAQDTSVIRYGVDPTFAPYESVNAQGKMEGNDIELGDAICATPKEQCKWVKINFEGAIPAPKAKTERKSVVKGTSGHETERYG